MCGMFVHLRECGTEATLCMRKSEDNRGCQSSPSTLFATGSLLCHLPQILQGVTGVLPFLPPVSLWGLRAYRACYFIYMGSAHPNSGLHDGMARLYPLSHHPSLHLFFFSVAKECVHIVSMYKAVTGIC